MSCLATRSVLPLGRRLITSRARLSTAALGSLDIGSGNGMSMPPGFNIDVARQPNKQPRIQSPGKIGTVADKIHARDDLGKTMPPNFKAQVAHLDTFELPEKITGSASDRALGKAIIDTWRYEGIIQIAQSDLQKKLWNDAKAASKRFFRKPAAEKAACVDSQSYAGYIASGEEVTDGIADYSEIFTITKDLDLEEPRVRAKWPCHGPCPWPDVEMKEPMMRYVDNLGLEGEKILQLAEFGLGVAPGTLTQYTRDGWHHTRVLRFPPRNATNGKGKEGRGIGSHTDYGLLVIAAQDDVGGLFIRRPRDDEKFANWQKSAAGHKEDADGWFYIPPVEGVHTVILGDMMQYLTNNYLTATPHKVGLNTRERFVMAYFHEPSFQAVIKPINEGCGGMRTASEQAEEGVHYGTHFTNMFMRNYPDRITTKRLLAENRYAKLSKPELRTMDVMPAPELD
ncbi:hypothetical protein GE21DRAFT_6094 [Neurospora crassa]|uniref:2-oxoglutarate-dependent ethylene/succinate-forming enzyme n=2 Tax=Neurospora crassa TaxID=5141 RepID=Q7RZ55_NEUCR|nr:2-oxoglutarate-dependent ethylene/succinate-forming enzyme [Neurospora crassa OR74A]EAA28260.3 2-oxoglutarate-dependent ethylene/succinate-forming enzyme [Neurospora crassa OR74A]KHE88571.1 hypothetical protein GE21DRAFT_6094 [Neurospora crassa]CAF06027.1 probable ethylene-forming enzyme [Neurospora crassa]|eukprot:XP_957496.3 2-oxoglutarate-dependent ethylene/succinate-forming enzyme [Neurospora crassa OR74A]